MTSNDLDLWLSFDFRLLAVTVLAAAKLQ